MQMIKPMLDQMSSFPQLVLKRRSQLIIIFSTPLEIGIFGPFLYKDVLTKITYDLFRLKKQMRIVTHQNCHFT